MATLKEAIVAILQTDAQLTGASNLGTLLGRSAAVPYGIYFTAPPNAIDLADGSYITYSSIVQSDRKPKNIFIAITAWGENFEAVQNRIYDLLHDASITSTDVRTLMLKHDFAGPELLDDDKKTYYRQDRFWAKGWKT